MYFLSVTCNLQRSNPHFEESLRVLDQNHMMNFKYSPAKEIPFCFQVEITLCVNEGLDSNSSSEDEVEYSVACFLTGRRSYPKVQEQNGQ